MMQDDPNQPGYGLPMQGYGDYESAYTQQRASYGSIPQGMLMGGYTVGAGAMSGMGNMMSDVGRMIRPIGYTPPARVMAGYGGLYAQQGGFFSSSARYMGFGTTPRGVTEQEYNYYNAADLGERIAGAATSAATSAAGMLIGMSAPMAAIGRGAGMFAGSALGPWGAAAGGVVGSMFLAPAAAMWAAGQVQEGVTQRREIQNFIENAGFRFATTSFGQSDPRFGAGMNISARQQVADFIRQQDVKDPMFNTQELTQVMQQSSQLGLFAGTRDVKDFQNKFKDIVESVKVVTRTLHQTLEEGLRTIKDLKAVGIDPAEAGRISIEADLRGKMAGRTGVEMMQLGLQGAEMFRGTGVSMKIGYEANVMGLAAIRAARDAGELSQEAIAQAGGEEALAQRMTASSLGFAQSAMGRGFAASNFISGQGFNAAMFRQHAMGQGGDFAQMALQAAQNLGDPRKLVEYQANQAKFVSEMGKQYGGQGLQIAQMSTIMSQAEFMTRTMGGKVEDNFRYSAQQLGLSESEIQTMLGRINNASGEAESARKATQASYDKMIYEQAAQNTLFYRAGSKIGDIKTAIFDTASRPLSYIADNVKESLYDVYSRHYLGIQKVNVDEFGNAPITANEFYPTKEKEAYRRTGRYEDRYQNLTLDRGAWMAQSAGETLAKRIEGGDMYAALGEKVGRSSATVKEGDIILDSMRMTGGDFVITQEEKKKIIDRSTAIVSLDAKAAETKATKAEIDLAKKGVMTLLTKGADASATLPDIAKAMFGKDVADMTPGEMAALKAETAAYPALSGQVEKALRGAKAGAQLETQVYLAEVQASKDVLDPAVTRTADLLRGGTTGAYLDLAGEILTLGFKDNRVSDLDTSRSLMAPIVQAETSRRSAIKYREKAKQDPAKAEEYERLAQQAEAGAEAARAQITSDLAKKYSPAARQEFMKRLESIPEADLKTMAGNMAQIQELSKGREPTGSVAGGGAGGAGDAGAEAAARTQTDINQQILAILQALAARMK